MKLLQVFFFVIGLILVFSFTDKSRKTFSNDSLQDTLASYRQAPAAWPAPTIDPGIEWREFAPLPLPVDGEEGRAGDLKVSLGKLLFFDPILSGSNQISCSSCHNPQTSWADHLSVPTGHDHQQGTRNTPSLLNVHARKTLFWDGRASSLEEQALGPLEAHHEMNMDLTKLVPKLKAIAAYRDLFQQAYGEEDFSMPEILEALASFQRSLVSRKSRFDEFMDGRYDRLTNQELHGLHLFRTKARCMNCHHGPFFTDESFHNVGLTYYKRKYEDLGRYLVTGDPEDVGKFRTPSLRDVMNTAPWMHNGLFDSMNGILNLYNSGMQMNSGDPAKKIDDPLYPVTDPLMRPLGLHKEEIAAIEAFLHAITGSKYKMPRPAQLPR